MLTMHDVVQAMEAQRRLPYWPIWLVGLVAAALVFVNTLSIWEGVPPAPAVQPGQQVEEIVQPMDENPPAQTEPGVVAPVPPVVVDYQVTWTEVSGFDPSAIPVEEGFYNAQSGYSSVKGAYAEKILPDLEGLPVSVVAVKDPGNKDIVFVGLDADRYGPSILLSLDGERSWYKLTRLPYGVIGDAKGVRVLSNGDETYLYGKDPRPGNHWWTATVKKSELP